MAKNKTFLKYALSFINIILFLFGTGLFIGTILFLLGTKGLEFSDSNMISLSYDPSDAQPIEQIILYVNNFVFLGILFSVRQFLKNIIDENIFVAQNVTLAKRVALMLLFVSFTTDGVFTFNNYSFFNIIYLITALVVWTLGMVLEKANEIAEENEFTI